MSEKINILVVTHKKFKLNLPDCYIPIVVGKPKEEVSFPKFYSDRSGESISEKNIHYCELTAYYWAWKNLNSEIIGIVHYRRLLLNKKNKKWLSEKEIRENLERKKAILPKKRNYFIETTWTHYENNHNINDLIEVKKIIRKKYPEYLRDFEIVMNRTNGHRFNILIMNKKEFDLYCDWLFSILFELEKKIDISKYDSYQTRVFGFLSERLLDVWIQKNDISYTEKRVKFVGNEEWGKKISRFLKNKIKSTKVSRAYF